MHPIGDQAQGHIPPQQGGRHRSRGAAVHVGHGVEGVGEHPHPGGIGLAGLRFRGLAVAQADQHIHRPQGGDHRPAPRQLRRQGHQGDVGLRAAAEAVDALLQCCKAWLAEMLDRMGAAAGRRQEWPLQMGPQ